MFGLRLRGRYRYKRSYKPGYIKFKKKKVCRRLQLKYIYLVLSTFLWFCLFLWIFLHLFLDYLHFNFLLKFCCFLCIGTKEKNHKFNSIILVYLPCNSTIILSIILPISYTKINKIQQ